MVRVKVWLGSIADNLRTLRKPTRRTAKLLLVLLAFCTGMTLSSPCKPSLTMFNSLCSSGRQNDQNNGIYLDITLNVPLCISQVIPLITFFLNIYFVPCCENSFLIGVCFVRNVYDTMHFHAFRFNINVRVGYKNITYKPWIYTVHVESCLHRYSHRQPY